MSAHIGTRAHTGEQRGGSEEHAEETKRGAETHPQQRFQQ